MTDSFVLYIQMNLSFVYIRGASAGEAEKGGKRDNYPLPHIVQPPLHTVRHILYVNINLCMFMNSII